VITASSPNEQTVLDFFATLSRGDLDGVRALLHEDATWTPQVREVPGAGTHKGHKGIIDEFLMPVRGLFEPGDPKVTIDSLVSKGPLVMVESRGVGKLRDGRPYSNLYAWAIEVRDGKIAAIREYMDSHYVMGLFS